MEKFTEKQYTALQKIFDYFNTYLFGGELPQVMINMSRDAKSYGFFAPKRWTGKKKGLLVEDLLNENAGKEIHEISINPDHMSRNPKEVCSTIVHEQVHLWQQEFDKPANGYHSKAFAKKMKEIGLQASATGQPGGKETGKRMSHYIIPDGLYEIAFEEMPEEFLFPFVSSPMMAQTKKEQKKKNKSTYVCPSCEDKVWGKPGMNIICGDCSTTEGHTDEDGECRHQAFIEQKNEEDEE